MPEVFASRRAKRISAIGRNQDNLMRQVRKLQAEFDELNSKTQAFLDRDKRDVTKGERL